MEIKYDFYELNIMIVFASFLGFAVENFWLALTKGYIDNRNMNLPFLLGYGLVILGFYIFVGTPEKLRITEWFNIYLSKQGSYIFYFAVSFTLVSAGEIILGTFVERLFGFEYWNYTRIPFHFTKYTSLPTSAGFGTIITFFMGYCFDNTMNYIHNMPGTIVKNIGALLITLLVMDFVHSFAVMYRSRSLNIKWVRKSRFLINKQGDTIFKAQ